MSNLLLLGVSGSAAAAPATDITPALLAAIERDGTVDNNETITTTVAASGNHPVLVVVNLRHSGAGNSLQDISATLDGGAMTRRIQYGTTANFQTSFFWMASTSVPAGTFDVVVTDGTTTFNGVSIYIFEMENAKDDQTGAVDGSATGLTSATSKSPSVTTGTNDSLAVHTCISPVVMTSVTGADTVADDGTTNSGNASTWCGLAYELVAVAGAATATFNFGSTTPANGASIEILKA